MNEDDDKILEIDEEALRRAGELLANAMVNAIKKGPVVEVVPSGYALIARNREIIDLIDLDMLATAAGGLTDILGQIAGGLKAIFEPLFSWVVGAIQAFVERVIRPGIDWISTQLSNFFRPAIDFIRGAIDSIARAITGGIDALVKFFTVTVPSAISGITRFFVEDIPRWFSNVVNFFTVTLPLFFTNVVNFFTTTLPTLFSTVVNFFTATLPGLFSTVVNFFTTTLPSLFSGVVNFFTATLPGLFSGVVRFFTETLPGLFSGVTRFFTETLPSLFSGVVRFFTETVPKFFETVVKFFTETLPKFFGVVADFFTKTLPSWISMAADLFVKFFTETLPQFGTTIVNFFLDLGAKISAGFEAVSRAFMGFVNAILRLPEFLSNIFRPVLDFFSAVGKFFTQDLPAFFDMLWKGLQEFFRDPLGWFKKNVIDPIATAFKAIGEWIWNALPDWLKSALEGLGNFFIGLGKALVDFFKDPIGTIWRGLLWIGESIWEALKTLGDWLWKGVQWLGKALVEFVKWLAELIWRGLSALASWIWEGLVKLGQMLWSAITSAVTGIGEMVASAIKSFVETVINMCLRVAQEVGNVLSNLIRLIFEPVGAMIGSALKPTIEGLINKLKKGEETRGELVELLTLFGLWSINILTSFAASRGLWLALHGLGSVFDKVVIRVPWSIGTRKKIAATPLGAGVGVSGETKGGIEGGTEISIGLSIRELASEIRNWGNEFWRALVYGYAIWITQPMMRLASAAFRDMLVVELPTIDDIIEMIRRHMPHKDYKRVLEECRGFLRLYGYRSDIINWMTSEDIKITITDRFGQQRTIPLSLMYALPSASDVARMAIRDIFGEGKEAIENFVEFYKARGMHPDVGVLYYLLHYRYPPPERLWTFVTRGISGLLWATITEDMRRKIAQEAERIKAHMPVPARDLNFKHLTLLEALQRYMTWHDYARFSWLPNFTSDNQIIIDTLADIPTKIDQRWMVKWGLYEELAKAGVTVKSEVHDFTKVVRAGEPPPEVKSGIYMELDNFCRTLQATGLHPYWVPVTAVAEAMNVLTEERTLLRTGFINLFKEGFWDVTALEKLLAGFIKAAFGVAHFDISAMEWKRGWIELPVMFLPAERKLLELRASMDRAFDILREAQRDISRAYMEHIVTDEKEYERRLSAIIDEVNAVFAQDYKAITGAVLPKELELKYVKDYYDPYRRVLDVAREIYVTRRIRTWTMRWIGWVMYRLATAVVSKEDVSRLVDTVSRHAKLTKEEREFINDVINQMYAIAVMDYVPTPSQLASLSEYVTIPEELIEEVFNARSVPQEWRGVWRTFISVRPLADDVRKLLDAYRRALLYTAIPEEIKKKVINYASKINFTQEEWDILALRVQLEELIMEARATKAEYVPTISMLVSMAEYVTVPEELIEKVLDVKRVPQEWRDVWKQYIAVRPLADDVRKLLDAYRRAILYATVPEDIKEKVINYASKINFTQEEWDVLALRAQLEELIIEAREARREYIPTPSMLATISEVVPAARELFEKVMTAKRVPKEWWGIWRAYIDYRPIMDEVKRMLSRAEDLYTYFAITKDAFKKILDELKGLGYTDREIELILLTADYERWLRAYRELIGDIDRMVTVSIYSPKARDYALGTLEKMIDALPIDKATKDVLKEMWRQYIRVRPIYSEVKTYVRDVVNLYVEGLITKDDLRKELEALKEWGLSDDEIMFWLKIADLRKARKLKIALTFTPEVIE